MSNIENKRHKKRANKVQIGSSNQIDKSEEQILKDLEKVVLSLSDDYNRLAIKTLDWDLDFTANVFETNKIKATKGSEEKMYNIILIGMFNDATDKFTWFKNINEIFYDFILKFMKTNEVGSRDDIKFNSVLKVIFGMSDKKINFNFDHKLIPQLVALINPAFNLIKFVDDRNETLTTYALIDLGIENTDYVNYNIFFDYVDNVYGEQTKTN